MKEQENTFPVKPSMALVFSLFVSNDSNDTRLNAPFEISGYAYAADSYSMVRCPTSQCDFEIPKRKNPPKANEVMPAENCSKLIVVEKEQFDFLKTEDEYHFTEKDVECKVCAGNGRVKWEFEHWQKDFDCPNCEGSGLSENKKRTKTGGKTFGISFVKMNNCYFTAAFFHKLLQVRDILGCDIILTHNPEIEKPALFRIGVCEVLIAPVRFVSTSNYPVLTIA